MYDIIPWPSPSRKSSEGLEQISWTFEDEDEGERLGQEHERFQASMRDVTDANTHENEYIAESRLQQLGQPETARASPEHHLEASSKVRSRIGHKKSRHGCLVCKRRKIKVFHHLRVSRTHTYLPTSVLKITQPVTIASE